ncbi:MAG TPA: hypothetical protein VLB68_08395 [Pyrinomonadaceae bacterium]|nr:hypothetical protein [Pyrinomonadaceae bacterium]
MMKLDVILSIKPLMEDYAIWIEAEEWEAGQWDTANCNSDVLVIFPSGKAWAAKFFTYRNLATLSEKNRQSGDCLHGGYFWTSNMILVDELTRARVEAVVSELLANQEFELVFSDS